MLTFVGRISYEGDTHPSDSLIDAAMVCAEKTRIAKEKTGVARLTNFYDLTGGEQVYVIDLEHVKTVHIIPVQDDVISEVFIDNLALSAGGKVGVADFVSGVVASAVIKIKDIIRRPENEPVSRPYVNRLIQTERSSERFLADEASHKIALEAYAGMESTLSSTEVTYSQHYHLKPGYYTGGMRAVVQLLLGVGRVLQQTHEQRWVAQDKERSFLDNDLRAWSDDSPVKDVRSAYGLFTPDKDSITEVKVRYDYRAFRTHGLAFGADGKCYLVEIGSRGVLAMPLPVDPVSTTLEGRTRYLELYPELAQYEAINGLALMDALGGFPTGVTFPTSTEDLEKAVKAGDVAQLVSKEGMAPYRETQFYSTATGWAFNDAGTEAHNTSYSSNGDSAQLGYHWAVHMRIAQFTPCANSKPPTSVLADATAYNQYTAIMSGLGLKSGTQDARKACRMAGTGDAEAVISALRFDAKDARKLFDDVTVNPDFAFNAHLQLVKRGFLWHPSKLYSKSNDCNALSPQPQFKFAEPLMNGCVSFDFKNEVEAFDGKCDTPIFVYFQKNQLHVVYYAYQKQKPSTPTSTNTRQPCQYVGAWETSESTEGKALQGDFYSTHGDYREELDTGTFRHTITTGSEVARTNFLAFCHFFGMHATINRNVYVDEASTTNGHSGLAKFVSATTALGDRSAFYVLEHKNWSDKYEYESYSGVFKGGTTSTVRHAVIYDFIFHWFGCPPCTDKGKVTCTLREMDCSPESTGESCFGDEPPDMFVYSLCDKQPGAKVYISVEYPHPPPRHGWTAPYSPKAYSKYTIKAHVGDIVVGEVVRKGEDEADQIKGPSSWWRKPSPDKCGYVATISVNVSYLGKQHAIYWNDFEDNGSSTIVRSQASEAMQYGTASTYIGVVE